MSALTDLFTAFANKIRSKTGGSDTYTPPQMVNAIDDVYQAGVDAGTTPTQTKTVTAGTTATTVTPDTGYALSSVTVNPTPSQSKSATPTTSAQTILPDSGKLLSSVEVGAIQTQTKSATPTTSAQTISPDSGKYLSSVSVGAIPSEYIIPSGNKSITANGTGIDVKSYATASVNVPNPTLSGDAAVGNVLSGKTFYNSDYTKRTGTMTNNGAVSPTALSAGGSYTVPAGYHNGSGVVSAKTLASQTGVDSGKTAIDASHVHSGYQGWVNGSKVSGTYTEPPLPDTPMVINNINTNGTHGPYDAYYATTVTLNVNVPNTPSLNATTLWTNSSPTSSFSSKTVTLSQSKANFDYLEFIYALSTSQTTLTRSIIIPASEFTSDTSDAANKTRVGLSGKGNSTTFCRFAFYVSNTSVQFSNAYNVAATGNTNASCIPLYIKGLKLTVS